MLKMWSRTQNCIVQCQCQQCKGKNAFTKGPAGNSQNGKMLQPMNFFPCSSQGFYVLHLIVVCVCVCVLVGGKSIGFKSIETIKPEVGEMPSHIQVRGWEKHFLPAMLMFLNFFTSLDYFFSRKRNSSHYWNPSHELRFVAVHGISAESSEDREAS